MVNESHRHMTGAGRRPGVGRTFSTCRTDFKTGALRPPVEELEASRHPIHVCIPESSPDGGARVRRLGSRRFLPNRLTG